MVLPILAAEVLVRVLGLAPDLLRIRMEEVNSVFRLSDNPILGYELRENARYTDQPHSAESKTNSHGQWDVERAYEKPQGTKRILVLGDSVVLGADVFDFRNTMTGVLERLYDDPQVEVLNFGVTGYCTRAEMELLKTKGLKYQPDIVVLVFVENDYLPNGDLHRTDAATQPAYAKWLFVKSALFRMACLSLDLFEFRANIDRQRAHNGAIGDDNVKDGLAMFAQLSQEYGFQPLVVIWPYFSKHGIVDRESRGRNPDDFLEIDPQDALEVEGLAREVGLSTFRLSAIFKALNELPDSQTRRHYSVDGMHATEAGCELAARAIKSILDANTVDRGTAPDDQTPPSP